MKSLQAYIVKIILETNIKCPCYSAHIAREKSRRKSQFQKFGDSAGHAICEDANPTHNEPHGHQNQQKTEGKLPTRVPITAEFIHQGDVASEERTDQYSHHHETKNSQTPCKVQGQNEQAYQIIWNFDQTAKNCVLIFIFLRSQALQTCVEFISNKISSCQIPNTSMGDLPLPCAVVAKLSPAFASHMRASLISFDYSLTSEAPLIFKFIFEQNFLEILAFAGMTFHFTVQAKIYSTFLTFACFSTLFFLYVSFFAVLTWTQKQLLVFLDAHAKLDDVVFLDYLSTKLFQIGVGLIQLSFAIFIWAGDQFKVFNLILDVKLQTVFTVDMGALENFLKFLFLKRLCTKAALNGQRVINLQFLVRGYDRTNLVH